LRLIGLDVGERRVGVAMSDPLGRTAQPYETISRDEGSIGRLAELVSNNDVEAVVVGLPLLMDGREGEQARRSLEFAGELEAAIDVPVHLVDERLTTSEADNILRGGRFKKGGKREASDRVAAAIILRAYMDSRPEE
jgi:putative Holliday junction resolvase